MYNSITAAAYLVKDPEANFIAQALPLKEFFGKDFVRNLI